MYNICVTGTGYVGLVTGACLADFGNTVKCVDIDQAKIAALKACEVPFYEPGLQEIVKRNVERGRLSFASDIKWGIESSTVVFVAVGTPMSAEGHADLSYVEMVAKSVGENLNGHKVVVLKSTVPAGTCNLVERIIRETSSSDHPFDVVSNPEFLREGSAVEDFMKPARIVLGASSERAFDVMAEIYKPLILEDTPVIKTDVKTAEMIKYASNAFLATKISFINEIANLCEAVGADVTMVARAMGLDDRIGPKFLRAGAGYGGSCFPKDTRALVKTAEHAGYDLKIVQAVIAVNEAQRHLMVEKIEKVLGTVKGKTVAFLGLAFKPDTDDLRDAPAVDMARELLAKGAVIKAYDPVAAEQAQRLIKGASFSADVFDAVKGADVAVFVTEWNEFRDLDLDKVKRLMRSPAIVDCRNIYEPSRMRELGFRYYSVGRAPKEG
ncbi:MAG TPA: UDP-glucose/GDP-mannose dehydrogenase family protein [bacterium]|nr:UDP-glucose/GDP-mannose dehydrogenase family protein [bacterium]